MSTPLTGLVPRRLLPIIRERLQDEAVVVLHGPRSVGKSTLLRDLGRELGASVIDLDEPAVRDAVVADPTLFASAPPPVLVDEFQHAPELLDAVKAELNRDLRPGRFVLTGSTSYTTLPRAGQALTGRAHVLPVWPLSQGEITGRRETFVERLIDRPAELTAPAPSRTTRDQYVARVLTGGLPIALSRPAGPRRARWFADYVRLVVDRDVLDIRRVRQREVLPLLLRRLAAQTAGVLNVSDLARRVDLERTVVEDYVQLLEAVFLIHRLPAWGRTIGARAGRAPKVHLVDSGLAGALSGLTTDRVSSRDPALLTEFGHLLGTFVVGEILRQASWQDEPLTVSHFRTHDGTEVDVVVEGSDARVAAVEVKAGTQVRPADLRGLRLLRDRLGDRFVAGTVLHLGPHCYTIEDRILACPLDQLWS
ncbi:MAG: ATP-binding protein [Pseudonocardiaceae bacterium]